MSMNYYLEWVDESACCEACRRQGARKRLHIGKSTNGWCFALHVIPEEGINSLADWEREFAIDGREIWNEEREPLDETEMLSIIMERPIGQRHRVGKGGCIANEEGPYDLISGVFMKTVHPLSHAD